MKSLFSLLLVVGIVGNSPLLAQQRTFNVGAARSTYRIGPGDGLRISIYYAPTYEDSLKIGGEYSVLPDGTLTLPLVGTLAVNGLEVAEIDALLNDRYASYFKKATVSVTVSNLRPVRVVLTGEVTKPGPYELKSGATLGGLLQSAGGVSEEADVRQVQITQSSGETRSLNLWELIADTSANRDILLTDGDRIAIPRSTTRLSSEIQLIARSSLGPGKLKIRMLGDVNTWVALDANTPFVPAALNQAGIPPVSTTDFEVTITRLDDAGQPQRIPYAFNSETAFQKDEKLQSGDILVVARRPKPFFQQLLDGLQTVTTTTNFLLNPIVLLRSLR